MTPLPRHTPVLEATLFLLVVAGALLWGVVATGRFPAGPDPPEARQAHPREIVMITQNAPHACYSYRDQVMGFEYDLASAFAQEMGAALEVRLATDWREMLFLLKQTPNAFIAAGMTITPTRRLQATFSDPYLTCNQHIIVHRENRRIRTAKDLAGKTAHVWKDTPYQESLDALKRCGIDLRITVCGDMLPEELLRRVADRRIDITIADTQTALLGRLYYPQLVIQDTVSAETDMGWAVATSKDPLLPKINAFFSTIKQDGRFKEIYDRYYAHGEGADLMDLKAYHAHLESHLPTYQPVIRVAAEAAGFDWRLIAAQIYKESHFDPNAIRAAHTFGLMQLTKPIAETFQVQNILDPKENITAGVRHLGELYDFFSDTAADDRMAFALAAYNIGKNHILDARKLSTTQGLDPTKWAPVSEALLLLDRPRYYRQADFGYCRGQVSVAYVRQTLLYYDILKNKVPAGGPHSPARETASASDDGTYPLFEIRK